MKKIFLIAAISLISITTFAGGFKSFYEKYSAQNNIETERVTLRTFPLALVKIFIDKETRAELKGCKFVQVMTFENIDNENKNNVCDNLQKMLIDEDYEIVLATSENGGKEQTKILRKKSNKKKQRFVVIEMDGDEMNVVRLNVKGSRNENSLSQLAKIFIKD